MSKPEALDTSKGPIGRTQAEKEAIVLSQRVDVALFYKNMNLGGVQHMMVRLANGLAERGYNVEMVVGEMHNSFRNELSDKVKVVDLGTTAILGMTFALLKYLRTNSPKALYTAVPNCNAVAAVAALLSGSNTKLTISERSDTFEEFRNTKASLYKLSIFLIPLTYRLAHKIVAVSAGTARSLSQFSKIPLSKIEVVYNPAFSEEIIEQSLEEVDHPWIRGPFKLVVAAGRLVPQKNFSLLLRAAALVVEKDPNVKFILLGEGPERALLEQLRAELRLEDHVDLPGADRNPFRWFAKADLFVLSSDWEGFGNVLVQALACGCQVVSTDCPSGPREILSDGLFGDLVEVKNSRALADSILRRLASPLDRVSQQNRARDFTLKAAVDEYERVFGLR